MATTMQRNNNLRNNLGTDPLADEANDATWLGYVLLIIAIAAVAWVANAFLFNRVSENTAPVSYTTAASPVYANQQYTPDESANSAGNNPAAVNAPANSSAPNIVPNNPYQSANSDQALQNRIPQSGSQ